MVFGWMKRPLGIMVLAGLVWGVLPGAAQSQKSDNPVALVDKVLTLYRAGKYPEATKILERFLAIQEKALGPEHPDVAVTLDKLAALHQVQGRLAEAEPFYRRCLAITEKTRGPQHPDAAQPLGNLARL